MHLCVLTNAAMFSDRYIYVIFYEKKKNNLDKFIYIRKTKIAWSIGNLR